MVLWLLPTLLFLGSFIIAKRVSGTGLRVADLAVIIWGVIGPTLMMEWPNVLARWTGVDAPRGGLAGGFIFVFPPSVVSALVLGLACRSWFPVVFTLAAGLVGTIAMAIAPVFGLAGMVSWNAVVCVGLLAWAWTERASSQAFGACRSCGYSLAGLRAERCPECGVTRLGEAGHLDTSSAPERRTTTGAT